MNARKLLPWAAMSAVSLIFILLFSYWAPFQFASMAAYGGLALTASAALCALFPFRFLGITRRRTGVGLLLLGVVLVMASLLWPASLIRAERHVTRLDDVMPEYHFYERHTARVHAAPAQVMAAIQQTTFGELPAYVGLMRVRGAVLRQKVQASDAMGRMRILDVMSHPGSGFLPLDRDEHEIVMGMAGRPWAGGRGPGLKRADDFASFSQPEAVKIAFNLRVDDAGNGWSQVTTETRILGLDDAGRRTMARYWRLIVPGSGMIRTQWLRAIRQRAEAGMGAS